MKLVNVFLSVLLALAAGLFIGVVSTAPARQVMTSVDRNYFSAPATAATLRWDASGCALEVVLKNERAVRSWLDMSVCRDYHEPPVLPAPQIMLVVPNADGEVALPPGTSRASLR